MEKSSENPVPAKIVNPATRTITLFPHETKQIVFENGGGI